MSVVDIYTLIISGFFGLYALACSVECAIALKLFAQDKSAKAIFTPLWEVTNVFLVFGFTGVAVIFNQALQPLSHALLSTLSVAFVALLSRACLGLVLFYSDTTSRLLNGLFMLANFATPLSFAAAGIYLLSGSYFWQSSVGWTLFAAAPLGLATVGLMILSRLQHKAEPRLLEQAYLLWLVLLGSVLPIAIKHSTSLLQRAPIQLLILASLLGICLVFLKYTYGLRRTWLVGPLLLLAAPMLLAWANRPYLISGQLTLGQAYGAQAFSTIFLIGAAVVLPLLLVGAALFAKLLRTTNEA